MLVSTAAGFGPGPQLRLDSQSASSRPPWIFRVLESSGLPVKPSDCHGHGDKISMQNYSRDLQALNCA